jgi:hypothetical protein
MPYRVLQTALLVMGWSAGVSSVQAGGMTEAEATQKIAAAQVPYAHLPEPLRSKVATLLEKPTLYTRGPVEAFPCRPAFYVWLLDRPHLVSRAWKALGAQCAPIEATGNGSFVARHPTSGELRWQEIFKEPGQQIWYAEGTGRPALLMPVMSLRAIILLQYEPVHGADGRVGIRHRTELFAQFDAPAAQWVSRMWGQSSETMARKMLEQVEIFFSGIAWYLSEYPRCTANLGWELWPEEARELEALLSNGVPSPAPRAAPAAGQS